MEYNIRAYVDELFRDAPDTQRAYEMKVELVQNLLDKYNDLVASGKTEEDAYNITIYGIGDIAELLEEMRREEPGHPAGGQGATYYKAMYHFRRRSAALTAVAVSLYIFSIIPVIVLGVLMTFAVSALLSRTILKGVPSSFTLELPPYRRPRVGQVLVRSVLDRTLRVLGRAAAVAAPAGVLIWCLGNVTWAGESLLTHCARLLEPFASLFGLDGVILLAFLLALPANELVLPLLLMGYLSQGALVEVGELSALHGLLLENGWTWVTALCVLVFTLFHWPCSTTCWTIWRETKSLKWTALSMALPTGCGLLLCFLISSAARLLGWWLL